MLNNTSSASVAGAQALDVSVLVPVYNNASTLDELIDRLLRVLDSLPGASEVILVDDGSRDASLTLLQRRAARDPRLRVFALVKNFGSQAASCAACDQARGRRIVHIDADLENFPEDIPVVLEPLDQGYDLVCGYRENPAGRSLARRLSSLLINIYVRRHTGSDIRDVGCGLKAVAAPLIHDLAAEGEARRLMAPVLLRRAHRVAQVPVRFRPKRHSGGHPFRWLLGITVDYYLLTARRPFLVSGLLSGALALSGVVLFAATFRTLGLALMTAGTLGTLLAFVGEYAQRIYHLAQGMPFYKLRAGDLHDPPK